MNRAHADVLLCTRIYTCQLDDKNIEVIANVFTPVECESGKYGCRYIMQIPEDKLERTIYGIDSLQAVHLAIFMLRNDLMLLNGVSDWRWSGATVLGLPLTANEEGGDSFESRSMEQVFRARCLVPAFDGAYFSEREKEALWDRFYTGAPQRQRRSVERYNIVKRA